MLRIGVARHAVGNLVAGIRSTAEITFMVLGPFIIGLLAAAALPPMYAATQPAAVAFPIFSSYCLALTLPVWMLRKRLLPSEFLAWQRPLPLPAALQWAANAVVAAMLLAPIAAVCAASVCIWVYQSPSWLDRERGITMTATAILASWIASILVLAFRMRAPTPKRLRKKTSASTAFDPGYRFTSCLPLIRQIYWLVWLPQWLTDRRPGIKIALLLAATAGVVANWLYLHGSTLRPWLAVASSVLLVLLMAESDRTVRSQIAELRVMSASWPLSIRHISLASKLMAVTPGLMVMTTLIAVGLWRRIQPGTGAVVFAMCTMGVQATIVGIPRFNPRGRAGFLFFAVFLMAATAGEL